MPLTIQDLYFAIALLVAGSFAGYTSGLFGIGGGLILVPLFLTIFPFFGASHSQVMHCAVGTSLALVLPNCWASVRKQRTLGNVDVRFLETWLPFVVLGAIIGLFVINWVPTTTLKLIFNAYLYVTFFFVLLKSDAEGQGGKPGMGPRIVGGTVFGALSVLLGVGGGTFTVPFLKTFRYPLQRALAVSSATGLAIASVGTVGIIFSGWGVPGRAFYSFGFVNVPAFIIVAPIALWLAPQGVSMAHRMSKQALHRAYASLLLVMAVYMSWHVFYGHY